MFVFFFLSKLKFPNHRAGWNLYQRVVIGGKVVVDEEYKPTLEIARKFAFERWGVTHEPAAY
jgi:hypothetical protein